MLKGYHVRLPGEGGVVNVFTQQPQISGRELVELVVNQHRVDAAGRSLIKPSTNKEPPSVIPLDSKVSLSNPDDILELWKQPTLLKIGIATSDKTCSALRDMLIDLTAPLTHIIPMLKRSFNVSEAFILRYSPDVFVDTQKTRALNSNFSLTKELSLNSTTKLGVIVVFPISFLGKMSYNQAIENCEREGALRKMSRDEKKTSKKKRHFVLKDNSLLYYSSPTDKHPCGFIPCEYFTCRMESDTKLVLEKSYNGLEFKKKEYILSPAEDNDRGNQLKDWFNLLKEKCVPGGDTRVFGVSLKPLFSRYTGEADKNPIPTVLKDTITWLDNFGLEAEGLFRLSGMAADIETYKNAYDSGKQVTFVKPAYAQNLGPVDKPLNPADPHTVAGLLKLFLRELPDPLIGTEMYQQFIDAAQDSTRPLLDHLLALIQRLPIENQLILKYLCSFLGRVASFSSVNRMNQTNLAIVFSPNLLRPAVYDPVRFMSDNPVINNIVETLILENSRLFKDVGPPEVKHTSSSNRPVPPGGSKPVLEPNRQANTNNKPEPSPYASMPNDKILKEGILFRKVEKKWKDAWVQLTRHRIVFCNRERQAKQTLDLYSVAVGNSSDRPHCFVITKAGSSEYLAAGDAADFTSWTNAIHQIIRDLADGTTDPNYGFHAGVSNKLTVDVKSDSPYTTLVSASPAGGMDLSIRKQLEEETKLRKAMQKQLEEMEIWKIEMMKRVERLEYRLDEQQSLSNPTTSSSLPVSTSSHSQPPPKPTPTSPTNVNSGPVLVRTPSGGNTPQISAAPPALNRNPSGNNLSGTLNRTPVKNTIPPSSQTSGVGGINKVQPPKVPLNEKEEEKATSAFAVYDFSATMAKQISLTAGDELRVLQKGTNGWWKGTSLRTGETGFFPSSFVRE
eukprot:TRINITY_DN6651_c0_g1_i1.p1 TRINITY_DN6651_c0_g1~~TRINITY_DN6651_c0_g1_i1.p1  ORF type:complete len:900 (-),score=261.88 TRINITY_DN6651_c0_g1_i1:44-2743(-)